MTVNINSEEKALEDWALNELKEVGRRGFEFSKYFFGISAGSFAIFSFFQAKVSLSNIAQSIGLVALAVSALIAVKMSDPANFTIKDDTELSEEHGKYVKRITRLRSFWTRTWLCGIFFVFLGMTLDFTFADIIELLHA